uniref:RING-type domain-containing protein n=1 Tax=viral metagenome TaxID=1070528 RepID=A0A6C0EHR7_9ZZZZ
MERYFIHYDKGNEYVDKKHKLMFVKITNTTSQYINKDEDLPDDYINFNNGYMEYEVNTRKELEYLNPHNSIPQEKVDDYKAFLDKHLIDQKPNNYTINYLYFDKYNKILKSVIKYNLSNKKGLYFGNKKINDLLIKINNNTPSDINHKNIFSREDCKLLYNFFDFLYFKFDNYDLYKIDKCLTLSQFQRKYYEISSIMTVRELCDNINDKFKTYMEKLEKKDTSLFKFDKLYYSSIQRHFYIYNYENSEQKISEYVSYHNQTLYKETFNFISNFDFDKANPKEVSSFINNNYYNSKYNNKYRFEKNYLPKFNFDPNNDVITLYNLNNNYNNSINSFINNYIFSQNTRGIFKFKVDTDFNYTDYITRIRYGQQKKYVTLVMKFDIYIHKDIFKSLFQNKYIGNLNLDYINSNIQYENETNIILQKIKDDCRDKDIICIEWINYLFNNKYNGTNYVGTKFNITKDSIKFNSGSYNLIKRDDLFKLVDTIDNNTDTILGKDIKIIKFTENYDKLCLIKELKTNPFEYQKQNVFWMNNIESDIDINNFNIKFLCNTNFNYINEISSEKQYIYKSFNDIMYKNMYYNSNGNVHYNSNGYITELTEEVKEQYSRTLKLCGGILTDEVGLGKTLSTILNIVYSFEKDLQKVKEDKTSFDANNIIICPNRLVTQWYSEIKKYVSPMLFKKLNISKITTITDIKKKLYDIKPNKHFIYIISSNLVNNTNYLNYLIEDEYDTAKYMKHIKLLDIEHKKPHHTKMIDDSKVLKAILKKIPTTLVGDDKTIIDELTEFKFDDKKKFNIFTLKWNRIILDEAHEVLNTNIYINSKYTNVSNIYYTKNGEISYNISKGDRFKFVQLCRLYSNYKWCLTATPFTEDVSNLYCYINFLNNDYIENINKDMKKFNSMTRDEKYSYFHKSELENQNGNCIRYNSIENALLNLSNSQIRKIFNTNIRRTTKADIKGVVDIPIFTEDITILKQNNVERNIYLEALRSNDVKRLLQLCTHVMVSDVDVMSSDFGTSILSLDNIKTLMVKKYKKNMKDALDEISKKEIEQTNCEFLISKLKSLKDKLNKSIVDDPLSIEPHLITEMDKFCSSGREHSRYGNSYVYSRYSYHHEAIKTIKSVFLQKEALVKYTLNLKELEETIKLIEFPKEFNSDIYKKYIIWKIYTNTLNNEQSQITRNKESLIKLKNDIRRLENQIKIFESNEFISEAVKDPCSICFMEYDSEIAITSCRHMMCGDCIKMLFNRNQSVPCPFCRTKINKKDVNFTHYDKVKAGIEGKIEEVKEEKIIEKSKVELDNEEKIQKYGTKLAYLLNYIGELFKCDDNKIIIFSQYDNMLKLIGKVLDDFKIKNLFVKGNITSVSKKIDKFKTDPSYRIIMLSSERCSSGSNLTEASHIIFADVVNGTPEHTKDIESQAIGRAVRIGQKKPVVVKRLVMKDTIEEEFYNKNKYDMTDLML